MDIARIEEQLNDLLDALGCPEKSQNGPQSQPRSRSRSNFSTDEMLSSSSVISPLERIVKSKPIWHCPDVTRDEAVKLLHNKKTGNFIVRGCRQPQTLALSVKMTDRENFPPVQHFIIIHRGRKVALEDSDLQFDNIVSLTFHYTQVCDELPERLCLPDVLATATSVQNLVSLSLLGKSFWGYPMAKSDRSSVFVPDPTNLPDPVADGDRGPLTRTPPRPPNRSRSSSQPQAQPQAPARQKTRRNSDSVPFIISPARVPRPARHSLADLYSGRGQGAGQQWVTSPVFNINAGRDSPPLSSNRSRKVSVFYNKLGHVEEDSEHEDNNNLMKNTNDGGENNDYSDLPEEEAEEADYAFPLDAIKEEMNDQSIYENPQQNSKYKQHEAADSDVIDNSIDDKTCDDVKRFSDQINRLEHTDTDYHDSFFETSNSNNNNSDKRKLSLGVIFRKLSTGSQQAKERKTSLQEKRLSTAITKLITLPIFERRTLGESYQVNSLSWEFLNKDTDDECWDKTPASAHPDNSKDSDQSLMRDKIKDKMEKHPSMDSLYESEFDSSSTMESTNSTSSSRLQHHQHPIVNARI